MTQFSDLGLAEPLLRALTSEGYSTPTPIQAQAIPIVLSGRDLVGLAQTGTGKTAAFALPMLHRLAAQRRHAGAHGCRALVLAPTRELAAQIGTALRAYGKFMGLSTAIVFGGASMHKQRQALMRGVDILVATPGRLLDHISQRSARIDGIEILVLDEADHMLDMGFIRDLKRIADLCPKARQTLFFSATMAGPIAELAGQFLNDPAQVAVTPVSSTAERVDQCVVHVAHSEKNRLLEALLEDEGITRGLIFARTKRGADRLATRLVESGHSVDALHGDKSQGQRERALRAFKDGKVRLLVATEIAARGIDVDEVSHVINFDLPNVPEQYVHRIGRTARAGNGGKAISFCTPEERAYLRDIEKVTKKAVPVLSHPLGLSLERASEAKPRGPQQRRPGRAAGEGQKPNGHAPQGQKHAHKQKARTHGRPQRGDGAHRDEGDRRDRKGGEIWSNAPAPQRRTNGRRRSARV